MRASPPPSLSISRPIAGSPDLHPAHRAGSVPPPPGAAPRTPDARQSALAQAVRELTGVVIWPHQLGNRPLAEVVAEARLAQKEYGLHLHQGIAAIGAQLRDRRLLSFRQTWAAAVAVRAGAPDCAPQGGNARRCEAFRTPMPLDHDLVTRLHPNYEHIVPSVFGHAEIRRNAHYGYVDLPPAMSEAARAAKQATAQRTKFPATNDDVNEVYVLPIHGVIPGDSEVVPLTVTASGLPFTSQRSGEIRHTLPVQHERIRTHLDALFHEALHTADAATFKDKAARLYWWSAHACFDLRSSAAKTEIVFRALHEARAMPCPLWKPGVSADLEAMQRTEAQWLHKIDQLQWSSQDMAAAIEASPLRETAAAAAAAPAPVMHREQSRLLDQLDRRNRPAPHAAS